MISNYLVEYQLNGIPSSFEFYLFVNPLGMKCYKTEQELINSLSIISSKVDLNIITFHNHKLVPYFLNQLNLHSHDLQTRNYYYNIVYKASIAYKTASLQGRKLGRDYLFRLQEVFNEDIHTFNDDLLYQIAKEIGLDLQIFIEDFQSDFVRQLFLKDQQIAQEMNVKQTPALVIFQNQSPEDGVLLREQITKEKIIEELDNIVKDFYYANAHSSKGNPKLSIIHKSNRSKN